MGWAFIDALARRLFKATCFVKKSSMKGLTFNALEHHFEAQLNVKCCVRATNNQLNFPRLSKSSLTGSWRVTLAVSNKLKKITPGPYIKTQTTS